MASSSNTASASYRACHRFARIAPRKARLVADMIRGKSVDEALTALDAAATIGRRCDAPHADVVAPGATRLVNEADAKQRLRGLGLPVLPALLACKSHRSLFLQPGLHCPGA